MAMTTLSSATFYDEIGGSPTIRGIVKRFYEGVAEDEVLRPLYPEEDLTDAEERFAMFLEQYWGGPTTYSDRRGHPRLRMRHAPFAVTPTAKEHWLRHFRDALDEADLTPEQDAQFWEYVTHAAQFMVNTMEDVHPAREQLASAAPAPAAHAAAAVISVVRCVSRSKVTITTAALASTRSSSRTSDLDRERPAAEVADPGVHRVRLLPVVHRRQVVDVGARDDVLGPALAAGVHVHQVADAGLLEVLEERTGPRLAALVEVGTTHGEVVDAAGRSLLLGQRSPLVRRPGHLARRSRAPRR